MTDLVELDERIDAGLVVRLMYTPDAAGAPLTLIHVYEGLDATEPTLAYETPAQDAREAFLHPYGYAP